MSFNPIFKDVISFFSMLSEPFQNGLASQPRSKERMCVLKNERGSFAKVVNTFRKNYDLGRQKVKVVWEIIDWGFEFC